jgi:exonuclease III
MISLTIYLILIRSGIEPNPGPQRNTEIITYNCNGLGDQNKLRRLLSKSSKKVQNGAIIFLQETHIVNTEVIKSTWKNKFVSNCKKTNSAGVIILFNNKYNVEYYYEDMDGRAIVVSLTCDDNEKELILANVYFPNDHKVGITFAENIYLKILEAQSEHPNNYTICAGDFNMCKAKEDSIGRNETKTEKLLAETVRNNNKVARLEDCYRSVHRTEGFTWKRGNIYSRLDYVYASTSLLHQITNAETDWAFESSDHAAVKISILMDEPERGPGIMKVNTRILEDNNVASQIGNEIEEMLKQADKNWNPHMTLEFMKVTIRSVFSSKVAEIRKTNNNELQEKEEELNQMENLKTKIHSSPTILIQGQSPKEERLTIVDKAILTLKTELISLRKKFNDKMSFVSKAKWFEFGEKSNKYFLNLNKARQSQKNINQIRNGDELYTGREQVIKGITNFYNALYSEQKTETAEDDGFYKNCPKLSEEQKSNLESELSLKNLKEALSTCKESAPGPDGIPYSVYKKYWNTMGPIIHEAWKYSLKTEKMPPSHLESIITLLPKEGKDNKDIKNWRPITLSNCDAKIITKAISLKTAKVLETIIDPSQTAYVPGRSITDNLRTNFYYKNYCQRNNIDAALISLDAKKAFDSVSHEYIETTLKAYGFGPMYLKTFRTLYNEITARILVNGFFSDQIKIKRGVKQGDALSCALFIICIDPLLRNINKNKQIKEIRISKKNVTSREVFFKGAAYADDISVICDKRSIQMVFNEYQRLTSRSGLELNAEKTEILILNKVEEERIKIEYNEKKFEIKTVGKIKICGLYYCSNNEEEYNLNVNEKIKKLSCKIKAWSHRHLTMEGKNLIVKTFGLSQIIYNMQSYEFKKEELVATERIIFKFLWSTNDNQNGIDRIKRAIMKNEYSKGGMKVTDIESMNCALKLKQFIRASNSNHAISKIQMHLTKNPGQLSNLSQEYTIITEDEPICKTAQITINLMTDHNRNKYEDIAEDKFESDKILIDEVSSINLTQYLSRKKKVFMLCILKQLTNSGIETLGDLLQTYEFETNEKTLKSMRMILTVFPSKLKEIAKCHIEGINSKDEALKYLMTENNAWKDINLITVKDVQVMMKLILNKTEEHNVNAKLGITNFKEENITITRRNCTNAKLRNIYFRLIHNDFFTSERMKRFGMTASDKCLRCGRIENLRHLIWECSHSNNIWNLFNDMVKEVYPNSKDLIIVYENIFDACETPSTNVIKLRVVQELIQIDRPKNWNRDKIIQLTKDLISIEKYNSMKLKTETNFRKKWDKYEHLLYTRQ